MIITWGTFFHSKHVANLKISASESWLVQENRAKSLREYAATYLSEDQNT